MITNFEAPTQTRNSYEEKKNARIARYEDLAEKNRKESTRLYEQSHKMADVIPFGQPILIGHHSESRDRNYRNKIWNTMGKSIEADKKAAYYDQRAAAAANNNAISSDDPDAMQKLRARIAGLEELQEEMKAINKIVKSRRKNYSVDEKKADLVKMGRSEAFADKIFEPDFCGRLGIAGYTLQNNNANIRRLKARLEQMEKHQDDESQEIRIGDIEIIDNVEENRVQVFFPGKPDADIRKQLKSAGFRWAPSNGCWQSFRNGYQLNRVREILSPKHQ